MIILYALTQSRAYRIAWLLEILNLPYKLEIIERDGETNLAPDALRSIHPLGKSPIIKDGDLVLTESGAIVEYLINRYGGGKLKPEMNSTDYWQYLHWIHYAEGSLMPLLVIKLIFRKIDDADMPFIAKPIANKITEKVKQGVIRPQLKLHLDYIESQLAEKFWLVGDELTGADIMMSFPLQAAVSYFETNQYPHISAYVSRLNHTESFKRAEQKLGPLTFF
ncbi:glutathione S-transferase [Basfia succiniciproducens]|uniref:Glutathione S-transferase n=1 Tax=Basfia succiniciproducens TaxID=653940 RepID=A0A1G5CJT0_9PAST|nr:glutathione S-transferase [Basfia succiniciproducens]QIM68887.1 glutathione S-transferase [Basfia succiniciproducens]SCY02540.1 glutathione S-transferase [Basfia succiniciproducens]